MTQELSFEQACSGYSRCYDNLGLARTALMRLDGVVGVGIGPKQRDNKLDTSEVCFLVYVTTKQPAAELEANAFVPIELAGVMTDVVQVGSRLMDVHNEFDARWLKQFDAGCSQAGSEDEQLVL